MPLPDSHGAAFPVHKWGLKNTRVPVSCVRPLWATPASAQSRSTCEGPVSMRPHGGDARRLPWEPLTLEGVQSWARRNPGTDQGTGSARRGGQGPVRVGLCPGGGPRPVEASLLWPPILVRATRTGG